MQNVAGIFYILIAGLLLSIVTALVEFLYKSKIDARKRKVLNTVFIVYIREITSICAHLRAYNCRRFNCTVLNAGNSSGDAIYNYFPLRLASYFAHL